MALRKKHWRNDGGTLRLANKQKVRKGEDFWAFEQEIPEIFKSTLNLLGEGPKYDPDQEESSEEDLQETIEINSDSKKEVVTVTEAKKPQETPKETQKKEVKKSEAQAQKPKTTKRVTKRKTSNQNGKV